MLFFLIYDENNEVLAEKPFPKSGTHQALVNAWPSWTETRHQYILVFIHAV